MSRRPKRRPRGSIEKRGENKFRIEIPLGRLPDGTYDRYRETFHGTEEEAEVRRDELIAKMDKKALTKDSTMTFGAYLSRWIESYPKNELEDKTYREYKRYAEKRIIPALGHIPLNQLTRIHFNDFYAELRKPGARHDGKGGKNGRLSAVTIHRIHAVAHGCLNHAVDDKLLDQNPATGARLPATRKARKRVWNKDQLAYFLELIRDHPQRPLILTLAYTGMRVSEALALKWADIDFRQETVLVHESLKKAGREAKIGDTKNHQQRELPMDPMLAKILRTHRAKQNQVKLEMGSDWNPLGLVFTTTVGTPMDRSNFYSRVWKPLMEQVMAAGHPYLNIHGLRHTFATIMMQLIDDPKVLANMLGHGDVAFTLREYDHPGLSEKRRAISSFVESMSEVGADR